MAFKFPLPSSEGVSCLQSQGVRLLFVVAARHTIFFETDGHNLAFDGVIAPARMRDPSISKSLSPWVSIVVLGSFSLAA